MVAAVENLFDVAELLIKNGADARIIAQVRPSHLLCHSNRHVKALECCPKYSSVGRTLMQRWYLTSYLLSINFPSMLSSFG